MMRRIKDTSGFTLIELLVTVAIISALAAIAIPLFLGDRSNASASKEEQTIQQAVVYTEDYYQRYGEHERYEGHEGYEGFETWARKHAPEIVWDNSETGVETSAPSNNELKLSAKGSNGNYYCVKLVGAGLSYGTGKTQPKCEESTETGPPEQPELPHSTFPS